MLLKLFFHNISNLTQCYKTLDLISKMDSSKGFYAGKKPRVWFKIFNTSNRPNIQKHFPIVHTFLVLGNNFVEERAYPLAFLIGENV